MEKDIQLELFRVVKSKIPEHVSAADEIAKILAISADSAYRRMRGEKPVTLDEASKLCSHFNISVDQLLNIQNNAFLFFGKCLNPQNFNFNEYLANVQEYMMFMQNFKSKEIIYLCKDIPLFHHYHFKDLAAFKYYFWMKTLLHFPGFANKKFSLDDYPATTFELGQKTLNLYSQLDVYELWNFESLNSTLRQIEFYHDSDLFVTSEEAFRVYTALEMFMDHLEKQAETGFMFNVDDTSMKQTGKFKMYFNELVTLDNSILAQLDGTRIAFQVHNICNFMMTRDLTFCNHTYENMQMLMRKSTLISSVSERERLRFFNRLRNKVHARKETIR